LIDWCLIPQHSSSNKDKLKAVSFSILQTFLKKVIVDIGLDPNNYSSNSFRRDGAHIIRYQSRDVSKSHLLTKPLPSKTGYITSRD